MGTCKNKRGKGSVMLIRQYCPKWAYLYEVRMTLFMKISSNPVRPRTIDEPSRLVRLTFSTFIVATTTVVDQTTTVQ